MLINRRKKFLFIHIWKTGGTSIRDSLKNIEFSENFECREFKHASASKARSYFGDDVYAKLNSFAVVRNPWDLQVSNYFYARQRPQHYFYDFMMKFKCFDEYIEWRCSDGFEPQLTMLEDDSGNIIVSNILRFENLTQDFQTLCRKFNFEVGLNKLNSSVRGSYREYYSDFSKRLIEKTFTRDIDTFNYKW